MRIPADVLARTVELSPRAFRILLAIEGYCRAQFACWPSNEAIAGEVGCSARQVKRCLEELESAGWVHRTFRTTDADAERGIRLLRRLDPGLPAAPADWDS